MKTHGEKFIVKYEKGSIRNHDLGNGIVIEIAAECNTDIRGNSDQVGVIVSAPEGHKFFKNGDKVLTHYLSSSDGNAFNHDGVEYHRVTLNQIFAKINDNDEFELAEDIYFCNEVKTEAKTDSGILTTFDGEKSEPLKLKITHTPSSLNKIWADNKINVGDIVMPQDTYNYKFIYNKVEYIKIDHKFISAVYIDEKKSA